MGANDKLDATFHGGEYTPDAEQVRASFANSGIHRERPAMKAGFDRWLETVRAEAWAEGHAAGEGSVKAKDNPYKENQ